MPDGPTRFMPLPEVVEPRKSAAAGCRPSSKPFEGVLPRHLYELAGEAARSDSAQYALASVCLRAVLERDPDHKEARRLLGYVPHDGGWATPFAVRQLKKKNVNHPTFGWVPADWVPHLDRGELPAPLEQGLRKNLAGCRSLRPTGCTPIGTSRWRFATEHFEIQTNVPLAEAIIIRAPPRGISRPLHDAVRRYPGRKPAPHPPFQEPERSQPESLPTTRLHQVYYFASKAEFVDYLSPKLGPEVALNLGFYDPPKSGRGRVPAYFYRDPDGQIPETATLYHEVSHQLLFETAGPNSYTKNFGNFWVFEGLGTYFETVTPQPDGSLEVGGLVGPRIAEAYQSLVVRGNCVPLAEFVAFDEARFRDKIQIYHNYQQAMALTVFLMQWNQGAYRDAFLDYVRDAYHGRIKRGIGRPLQDRLHQPYATLDKQFLTFLKDATAAQHGAEPAAEPKPVAGATIRTVPGR